MALYLLDSDFMTGDGFSTCECKKQFVLTILNAF